MFKRRTKKFYGLLEEENLIEEYLDEEGEDLPSEDEKNLETILKKNKREKAEYENTKHGYLGGTIIGAGIGVCLGLFSGEPSIEAIVGGGIMGGIIGFAVAGTGLAALINYTDDKDKSLREYKHEVWDMDQEVKQKYRNDLREYLDEHKDTRE